MKEGIPPLGNELTKVLDDALPDGAAYILIYQLPEQAEKGASIITTIDGFPAVCSSLRSVIRSLQGDA